MSSDRAHLLLVNPHSAGGKTLKMLPAVERELIGMDVSRARRAEVIDEHAAIFILQGALDRLTKLRRDA